MRGYDELVVLKTAAAAAAVARRRVKHADRLRLRFSRDLKQI